MSKYKKNEDTWGMLRTIFSLALPTMLEQLSQTAVQYIDTAMVGRIGTSATAAVGSTSTVNWVIGSTVSAISVGFLSFIARAYGASNKKVAARATGQATLAVLASGVIFTVLALSLSRKIPIWLQVNPKLAPTASRYFFIIYTPMIFRAATIIYGTVLRAAGDTKTPMRIGILVNVTNVILNYILIYPSRIISPLGFSFRMIGAGWGVEGAAIASAISFTLGGVCTTLGVWTHPVISPKGIPLRVDWTILRPCLRVAFPNMLQRFGTSLGYVAFASMINSLGAVSTAAHTIANTVESAFYIPGYGMQTAAATLAGNALGAGDNTEIKRLSRVVISIEFILMVLSGIFLFFSAPFMMSIFSNSDKVISLGSDVLRMVAISEPFYGVSIIIEGIMLGVGSTFIPFLFNITGMWGVRILGTYFCTQILGFGLRSAWGCMILHNMILFILFAVYFSTGFWNSINLKKISQVSA